MNLQDKTRTILEKYNLCDYCLGRQFSNLATGTTNKYRGQVIKTFLTMAHSKLDKDKDKLVLENLSKSNFNLAKKVLKKKNIEEKSNESCYVCEDSLKSITELIEVIIPRITEYEFKRFLVGTKIPKKIFKKEKALKAEFEMHNSEFLKQEFNRNIGKKLAEILSINTDFTTPELIIEVDPFAMNCHLLIKSVYIYGRYKKFVRTIPQTRWPCRRCKGKGCRDCNQTGRKYDKSVEELIECKAVQKFKGEKGVLHGAGREDIDALMLGTGRPFVLEVINPKIRDFNLQELEKLTNLYCNNKVEVSNYRWSSKKEIVHLKSSANETSKTYRALVKFATPITNKNISDVENNLSNIVLEQKTPTRVVHRRADKIRKKKILSIDCKKITGLKIEVVIKCEGGTYVKEFISGDGGRTRPSIAEIVGVEAVCKELDVIGIDQKPYFEGNR